MAHMRSERRTIDWAGVAVHAAFGAILGSLLGLFWAYQGVSFSWRPIIGCALAMGVLGGVFGDAFWRRLASLIQWW